MKRIVLSTMMGVAMLIASAPKAEAAVILVFGQTGLTNTITGTANVGGTQTTIVGNSVPVAITAIENGVEVDAFFSLNATSTTNAVTIFGSAAQLYQGTFCVTSGAGCTGTNYLSGTFDNFVLTSGALGGAQLNMGGAEPPGTVTFTENSTITSLDLGRAFAFSFTNVTPGVNINNLTIGSFTASVSGNMSANVGAVPEPGSMMLLGSGLLGLAAFARRRVRKS
jgi:hypothetical protein